MPRVIPHRELRNRSSEVLREVESGETFHITNHGDVVALLAPVQQPPGAGLRVRRATHRGGFAQLTRTQTGRDVQRALDDLRGER